MASIVRIPISARPNLNDPTWQQLDGTLWAYVFLPPSPSLLDISTLTLHHSASPTFYRSLYHELSTSHFIRQIRRGTRNIRLTTPLFLWRESSVIEVDLAIICACLPALKPFLNYLGPRVRIITSKMSLSKAGSSSSASASRSTAARRSKPTGTESSTVLAPTTNSTTICSSALPERPSAMQLKVECVELEDAKYANAGAGAGARTSWRHERLERRGHDRSPDDDDSDDNDGVIDDVESGLRPPPSSDGSRRGVDAERKIIATTTTTVMTAPARRYDAYLSSSGDS